MITWETEDNCVGCPRGCINCGRKHQAVCIRICDRCKEEVDTLYNYDGEELCLDCIKNDLDEVIP